MSIYPPAPHDAEPTHTVTFHEGDGPMADWLYSIWEMGPHGIKGDKVLSGTVPPGELLEGAVFWEGYQVVGVVDYYNADFPQAWLRPVPELLVPIVRAWSKALMANDDDYADRATQERRAAVQALIDSGVSEYKAADMIGVTRVTIRTWLGK